MSRQKYLKYKQKYLSKKAGSRYKFLDNIDEDNITSQLENELENQFPEVPIHFGPQDIYPAPPQYIQEQQIPPTLPIIHHKHKHKHQHKHKPTYAQRKRAACRKICHC
jgi:hypothetical protein